MTQVQSGSPDPQFATVSVRAKKMCTGCGKRPAENLYVDYCMTCQLDGTAPDLTPDPYTPKRPQEGLQPTPDPSRTPPPPTMAPHQPTPARPLSGASHTTPGAAPQATRLTLPATRATRMWLEYTEALIAEYTARQGAIDAQIQALAVERDEIAAALAAIRTIPDKVQIASAEKLARVGMRKVVSLPPVKNGLPPGQWALRFDRCIDCGVSDKDVPQHRHAANGRCRGCASKFQTQQLKDKGAAQREAAS